MRIFVPFIMVCALLLPPGVALGVTGDFDADGDVDLDDYGLFYACFDGPGVPPAGSCPGGVDADLDNDGDVDLDDFAVMQAAFAGLAPTMTELAGNSLGEYPHFEYVKAFNDAETLELALDPTRFPGIIGKTADIYVVEAKSAGQWQVDPSLVDATADGAMTVTFSGTTIQENTFTVAAPYDLDSAVFQARTGDYTGLGHGYDMVVDANQNGLLDGGDFLDGGGKQAGLYVVHDTTLLGPLAVTQIDSYSVGTIYGIPSNKTFERLYFPTNIASMDPCPLIVISRGNGHQYTWYDHIGQHMGSYGYIVMSHDNNTEPGIDTASLTTCGHTDAVISLGQAGSLPGASALAGKIDTSRIIWIGHSRGGEGVAMAYHRVAYATGSCQYTPDPANNWDADSLVVVSSMLPTDFYGAAFTSYASCTTDPRDGNYHLWTASGDADVSGVPGNDVAQTFHLHDRAEEYRHSTVVQGTGHAWFHDGGGGSVFTGPCPIGEANTHLIQLGYFLPLIKYYAEANVPATDYFWRQYESFRPPSVPSGGFCSASGGDAVVVNNTYSNGSEDGNFVIDDYQTNPTAGASSSGGAVTYSVSNLTEDRFDDGNTSFTWSASDPMNGFTYGATAIPDDTRGVVFDWDGANAYYEWEIIADERDFTDNRYLSFRVAQGTRHPHTVAVLGDLTFSVTMRDTSGETSSINIGAYGGGVEEPFQRTGEGSGTGWAAEFETIRIRLTDFLTNGADLDLSNIAAVRLDFGSAWGSTEGRIGLDDVMLTNDLAPYFAAMTMTLPVSPPDFLPPGVATNIDVEIQPGDDEVVEGSALLHYRYDGGVYQTVPLTQVAGELWRATLPAPDCGDRPEFHFSVEGAVTGPIHVPPNWADQPFVAFVGTALIDVLADDFETDQGWTVWSDPSLTGGEWERGVPIGGGDRGDPPTDYDGSGQCYLTQNVDGNSDVDGGPTIVTSPIMDMSAVSNPVLKYARWWRNDDQDGDPMYVQVSNDGGANWTTAETVINVPAEWFYQVIYLDDLVPPLPLTDQMQVRFSVEDVPSNSIDEGGIDAVEIIGIECE